MGAIASQITSLTIVYSTVYSDADQRKHQSSASLCAGNSSGTGEFPAQMVSNAENVSIWWRYHEYMNVILHRYPDLNGDRWRVITFCIKQGCNYLSNPSSLFISVTKMPQREYCGLDDFLSTISPLLIHVGYCPMQWDVIPLINRH